MTTRLWMFAVTFLCGASMFAACSIGDDDNPVGDDPTEQTVEVQQLSSQMAAVRDYVPLYAVLAHRGSTYWTPEETESAWRWAREMGADYLESDLQCTKDGIILANHDVNLKRTTNIEAMFAEGVPQTRVQFYEGLGFSHADAQEQYEHDAADFQPYYTRSYYYAELLMLDAGSWFNAARPEHARPSYAATRNGSLSDSRIRYSNGQYVSALQDQMAYARGKMLKRGNDGERVLPYAVKSQYQGMTLREIRQATGGDMMDFLEYDFSQAYVADPQDSGHRPGSYFKIC